MDALVNNRPKLDRYRDSQRALKGNFISMSAVEEEEETIPSTVDVLSSMGSLGLGEELKDKIMGALSELAHLQHDVPDAPGSVKVAKQASSFLFSTFIFH